MLDTPSSKLISLREAYKKVYKFDKELAKVIQHKINEEEIVIRERNRCREAKQFRKEIRYKLQRLNIEDYNIYLQETKTYK